MAKSKLPSGIKAILGVIVGTCPICGTTSGFGGTDIEDKRYRGRLSGIHKPFSRQALTNRRITARTVTRECRRCGFRFSFRWVTLRNTFLKKAEDSKIEEEKKMYLRMAKQIQEWIDFPTDPYYDIGRVEGEVIIRRKH
jgi:hypothetical protein